MASVEQVANSSYDADIVLESTVDGANIILGSNATNVTTLSFTLLSDPDKLIWVTSSDAIVHGGTTGVYKIMKSYKNENLKSGTVIARLLFSQSKTTPVALTDTVLESDGVKYNLTSKVQ